MPTPVASDLYVSRPLTNLTIAYFQDDQDFVASTVFPPVPSSFQYGMYYTYNRGDWLRTAAQKRAPRTESAGTGWRVGRDTFAIDVNAVHVDVADQDRANTDKPAFDLDRDATNFVAHDILLRREIDWVEAYFGPGIWGTPDQQGAATAGTNQFIQWDRSSSTPIEDIEDQRVNMGEKTGKRPNVLVLGPRVYSVFKNHPQFLERIKYTQKGVVTRDLMASLLEVDQVVVAYGVQNTEEEGDPEADEDISFLYGNGALLAYAAPAPGLMQPSAGYTFEWTGYLGAAARGTRTSKFRMEALKADRVETESAYDFKVVSSDLAVFFNDAVQ